VLLVVQLAGVLYGDEDDRLVRGEHVRCGPGTRASKVLASRLANTYEVRALTDLRGPRAAYRYVFVFDARGVLTLVSEMITLVSKTVAHGGRS
jgi:hypothetical protein